MVDLITPPPAIIDVDHDGDEGHDEHHGATGILKWMTSTDHKVIGLSYTVTSVVMLIIGGLFARSFAPNWLRPTERSSRSPSTTNCSPCTAR